jgi:amidophosphoribosyltransferase
MGELLATKLNRYFQGIDVIAPIPNTPISATRALAAKANIKYTDVLYLPSVMSDTGDPLLDNAATRTMVKTSRTFILPTQNKRELAVKDKFCINVDAINECQGKTLALVDDSIVRGTTMKIIVDMIHDLVQPKKIILVSLAPPARYENVFGIDIPNRDQLIAHNRSLREIAVQLAATEVVYGDLDSIIDALKAEAHRNGVTVDGYEHSVFRQ